MSSPPIRICLTQTDPPSRTKEAEIIPWFWESLGIVAGRDTGQMASAILGALLSCPDREKGIPVEQIAAILHVPTSRINHHIRNLVSRGILYRHRRLIRFRGGSLKAAVHGIRVDTDQFFDLLEAIAGDIEGIYAGPSPDHPHEEIQRGAFLKKDS